MAPGGIGLRYLFKNIKKTIQIWGLIITAAPISRGPSRPLPASPARSGGCRQQARLRTAKYGRSYDQAPNVSRPAVVRG